MPFFCFALYYILERKEVKGMSRKKKAVPKSGPIWHQSAEEATLAQMPKFNAYACRAGVHGDTKYNRARGKQAWRNESRNELRNEGPRMSGGLPFGEFGRVQSWEQQHSKLFQPI